MQNISRAWTRWKDVLIITLLMRIILLSIGIITNPKIFNIFEPWVRWDGPHYIDIARNGYQNTGEQALWIVFYPLYPITIKIFSFFLSDFSTAAIMVSIVFSFFAAIFLYELVLLDYNERTAFISVWFLTIFPTAYFLQASYTESIYLTFSLGTIYFFRKKSLSKSVIFGIMATMTRINGIFLIPILLLESKKIKHLITLPFIMLGFLFYLSINFFLFGDFLYFSKPLAFNWHKKFDFPWTGVTNLIHSLPPLGEQLYYAYYTEFAFIVILLLVGIYALIKIRASYSIYIFINLLLFTSTSYIMSTPRYSLILFPIYIALAQITNRYLILFFSAVSLILLFFFTSQYTQGGWAF